VKKVIFSNKSLIPLGDLLQKVKEHKKKGFYIPEEDVSTIFLSLFLDFRMVHSTLPGHQLPTRPKDPPQRHQGSEYFPHLLWHSNSPLAFLTLF
jgi:hypothetical protein